MRAGWFISLIGHIGAVLMTLPLWPVVREERAAASIIVPVEIVSIGPESNVRALAPPEQEPEASASTQQASETVPDEAAIPTPRQEQRPDRFDLNAVAQMANRDNTGQRRVDGAPSDRTQRGAGPGTAEVASLQSRIQAVADAHIGRNQCWRGVQDLPNPERLEVTVAFELNRNGTLRGQPRVLEPRNYTFDNAMRTAVDRAVRAVRLCDPFPFGDDPVLAEHYDLWREMVYDF